MRQRHAAGERMFVDYSGTRMAVIDPATGVARPAEIFIAVMGASNMTYAEASWSQALPDWIGAHTRALFGVRSDLWRGPLTVRRGAGAGRVGQPQVRGDPRLLP